MLDIIITAPVRTPQGRLGNVIIPCQWSTKKDYEVISRYIISLAVLTEGILKIDSLPI